MSALALVTGRLHGELVTRQTRTGGQFTAFKLRIVNGNAVEWWSVTTFSETAREELAGLADGDAVSCVGALAVETYQKNGETRIALRLTADRVMTLKPRPKEAKPRAATAPRRSGPEIAASSWARPTTGGALDDDIPF